ncbi:addiction module protein [Actomonas aquatica]|uniref:Addiction module protein n=1 Tax=Actomonas aquatica TaxID=2866162 RepID=A0ABZ1C2D8_9BACT|nr:addiction module protein [Opitutus sp. WL0086]WRQ85871.1 addiction module protein [Opitutus sp. WL0086]
MSAGEILETMRSLSPAERRDLVAQIWSEFAEDDLLITAAQAEELDRRLAAHEAAPEDVVSWAEIQQANRDRRQ